MLYPGQGFGGHKVYPGHKSGIYPVWEEMTHILTASCNLDSIHLLGCFLEDQSGPRDDMQNCTDSNPSYGSNPRPKRCEAAKLPDVTPLELEKNPQLLFSKFQGKCNKKQAMLYIKA